MNKSIFKTHIKGIHSELNQKAGRTRNEIADMLPKDKPLYKLSSNENPLGASPKAIAAIQNALNQLHEYGHRVDDELRIALEAHFNHEVNRTQFITGNGGLELIQLIIRAFVNIGDEVIFSNPTFHVYEMFTEIEGGVGIDVPLLPDTFALDVDGILNAINDRTKIIVVTNPNNPTGTYIPQATFDKLMDNIPDHVVVIYDEVYFHFSDAEDFPKATDYINAGKNLIGLHSLSKAYGLAGMRLGYAFASQEVAEYLNKLRRPFFINTLSIEGGIAALQDVEHLQNTINLNRQERQWLYKEFDNVGITYWDSHTNFILFKSPIAVPQLVEAMLKEGVMVRPGDNNGAVGTIRVTIGTHDGNVAFIEALKKVI